MMTTQKAFCYEKKYVHIFLFKLAELFFTFLAFSYF